MIMFTSGFFLSIGFSMFVYGMIKTMDKIEEIQEYVQKMNERLDEHEKRFDKQ